MDWARADYFLILCSDDLLAKGALERAARLLSLRPDVHLAHGAAGRLAGEGSALPVADETAAEEDWRIRSGSEFIEFACRHAFNPVTGPTAVVRTVVQKAAGHYRPSLSHTDDLEMWLRIALHGSVATTRRIQAYARSHPHNQSATVDGILHWNREFEAGFRSFFEHEGADMPDRRRLFALARNCLTKRAYWSAVSNLLRREKGAASLMRFALKRRPLLAVVPPVDYLLMRSVRRGVQNPSRDGSRSGRLTDVFEERGAERFLLLRQPVAIALHTGLYACDEPFPFFEHAIDLGKHGLRVEAFDMMAKGVEAAIVQKRVVLAGIGDRDRRAFHGERADDIVVAACDDDVGSGDLVHEVVQGGRRFEDDLFGLFGAEPCQYVLRGLHIALVTDQQADLSARGQKIADKGGHLAQIAVIYRSTVLRALSPPAIGHHADADALAFAKPVFIKLAFRGGRQGEGDVRADEIPPESTPSPFMKSWET